MKLFKKIPYVTSYEVGCGGEISHLTHFVYIIGFCLALQF
jgi:hypothetical protein